MHIVSVVTLLVGSIFAYSLAAPQTLSPVNIAALSSALAQLAQQLAGNTTIEVGNSSSIVSGVSSSFANAHIEGNRPGNHHQQHHGWNNGWNNGWGYWRGAAEEEYKQEGDELERDDYQSGGDEDANEEEHLKF